MGLIADDADIDCRQSEFAGCACDDIVEQAQPGTSGVIQVWYSVINCEHAQREVPLQEPSYESKVTTMKFTEPATTLLERIRQKRETEAAQKTKPKKKRKTREKEN